MLLGLGAGGRGLEGPHAGRRGDVQGRQDLLLRPGGGGALLGLAGRAAVRDICRRCISRRIESQVLPVFSSQMRANSSGSQQTTT